MTSLQELVETLEELSNFRKFNKLKTFEPYDKQLQFFGLGATKRERCLFAGNQLGKSEGGAYEVALHLTGRYPNGWNGRRWGRAVRGWAAGETGLVVRDVQQRKLFGEPGVAEALGSGFVPKDCIVSTTLARGASNAYDTVQVRHVSGEISIIKFKSYEQGREKFQAETLDFVWLDEEPGEDIYGECLARITATGGMLFTTFTPLKGRTDVVERFMDTLSPDRDYVTMTIYDAKHIKDEERQKIIDGYKPHEREARTRGIPMQGEGRIFTIAEETIIEPTIPLDQVPLHWAKLWSIDFGINHPFAAVLLAYDRDVDCCHVLHEIRIADGLPLNHAQAMMRVATNVPVAWPQDGTQRDKKTGLPLSKHYRDEGLKMLEKHATWPDGSVSTEAAVTDMMSRMQHGRLKVGAHCFMWLEEYRNYHRKDGEIVKVKDDLLSATQKGIMMKRAAQSVPLGSKKTRRRSGTVAEGMDFDVFAG